MLKKISFSVLCYILFAFQYSFAGGSGEEGEGSASKWPDIKVKVIKEVGSVRGGAWKIKQGHGFEICEGIVKTLNGVKPKKIYAEAEDFLTQVPGVKHLVWMVPDEEMRKKFLDSFVNIKTDFPGLNISFGVFARLNEAFQKGSYQMRVTKVDINFDGREDNLLNVKYSLPGNEALTTTFSYFEEEGVVHIRHIGVGGRSTVYEPDALCANGYLVAYGDDLYMINIYVRDYVGSGGVTCRYRRPNKSPFYQSFNICEFSN